MPLAGTTGTVSFVGNSPLLTGSFSGLDTAAIIEASLAVKRIPIDRLENKISQNDTRIARDGDCMPGDHMPGLYPPRAS